MRGRFRYLLALAFLAMFALLPAPSAETGKPYLAYLQVRGWLVADETSPLTAWVDQGTIPPLAVNLFASPPIEDEVMLASRTAEFERLAEEWARANSATVAPARQALPMEVRFTPVGVWAMVPQPSAEPLVFQAMFPNRVSLLPACLTIIIALVFRRVLLALLIGGLSGAIAHCMSGFDALGFFSALGPGVWHFAVDALFLRSLCSDFYVRITLFVVFLFMTVGVITKNGGITGLVQCLQHRVRGPVGAQLATWLCGLGIFFDDYTNCMVTGTAMRPLCDAERVSREKLAYLVDSTAAPVAGVSLFSTWIVYEISQFRAPLGLVTNVHGELYSVDDAYAVFISTLPFRFYCFFALILVPLVVVMRRDFGPMLAAERRARAGGPIEDAENPGLMRSVKAELPAPGLPFRARNALIPMGTLVVGAAVLMLVFGVASHVALFSSSLAAFALACGLSLGQRLLTGRQLLRTSLAATRALGPAFGILFLAWTLGHISQDLGTRDFLTAGARGVMAAAALPIVLFALSGVIAFATGTSFGTMAILLPNVVLLAHQLGTDAAFLGDAVTGGPILMMLSIGAVLEGAIFGDHCSPISDTTVLSSLGSRCDHLAHVSTQLPYAMLCAGAAMVFGYLPMVTLGPSWWPLSYAAAILGFVLFLRFVGRDPTMPAKSNA